MPGKGARKNVFRALLAAPLIVVLVTLEVGFRVAAYFEDARLDRALAGVGDDRTSPAKSPLRLSDIIRWHPNPKIIYELIPGRSGVFEGAALSINADGFRGPAIPAERAGSAYRIVGIGDSVMFGWGVADGEPYLARLREEFRLRSDGVAIETLNSAVPGYNTVMAVETAKEKLLDYRPDLVIYDYVGNDLHLPSFIRNPRPYLALGNSFLYDYVKRLLKGRNDSDHRLGHPPDAFRHRDFEANPDAIPERFRGLVGAAAFDNAIAELSALGRAHGFRILVFAHAGIPEPVRRVLAHHGLPAFDAYPAARRYLREQGIDTYQGSPLTVSTDDPHPSSVYHAILSTTLATYLAKHIIE